MANTTKFENLIVDSVELSSGATIPTSADLDNKIDKPTAAAYQVCMNNNGSVGWRPLSAIGDASAIPWYSSSGTLRTKTPDGTNSNDAVNITYYNNNLTHNNIKLKTNAHSSGTIFDWNESKYNFSRANRFAWLSSQYVTVEKSTDNGATWTVATYTENNIIDFFTNPYGNGIYLCTGTPENINNCQLRITIDIANLDNDGNFASAERYFGSWHNTCIWASTAGVSRASNGESTLRGSLELATIANPDTWTPVAGFQNIPLAGWSGPNDIEHTRIGTFGGNKTQVNNNRKARFTFWVDSENTNLTANPSIGSIFAYSISMWLGNSLAWKDAPYSFSGKNILFNGPIHVDGIVKGANWSDILSQEQSDGRYVRSINSGWTLYGTDSTGVQKSYSVSNQGSVGNIPMYSNRITLQAKGTPTEQYDLINKAYADTLFVSNNNCLDFNNTKIDGTSAGITWTKDIENETVSFSGASNGSYATAMKIVLNGIRPGKYRYSLELLEGSFTGGRVSGNVQLYYNGSWKKNFGSCTIAAGASVGTVGIFDVTLTEDDVPKGADGYDLRVDIYIPQTDAFTTGDTTVTVKPVLIPIDLNFYTTKNYVDELISNLRAEILGELEGDY